MGAEWHADSNRILGSAANRAMLVSFGALTCAADAQRGSGHVLGDEIPAVRAGLALLGAGASAGRRPNRWWRAERRGGRQGQRSPLTLAGSRKTQAAGLWRTSVAPGTVRVQSSSLGREKPIPPVRTTT